MLVSLIIRLSFSKSRPREEKENILRNVDYSLLISCSQTILAILFLVAHHGRGTLSEYPSPDLSNFSRISRCGAEGPTLNGVSDIA